jgi:hypothetical protein
MSTFDDAIATHCAHGAGACSDPLTDSLAEQTQQPRLREGWEDEPIDPPHAWGLYALAVLVSFALAHCTSGWSRL